jgi:IPT/TIG domain-containing protein
LEVKTMTTRFLRMRRRARRTTDPVRRPLLETLEPRTLLSAVTWTGGAGDNNWDTPANWSTDSVPGSADDVTIDIAANVVHSDDVTDSIHSLTSTEPLTISGGTLSIASASTIGGALTIGIPSLFSGSGGTLTGAGNVSVSGLVTLASGTLSGSGALNANGGMQINPGGGVFHLDGRIVNNAAGQTATWSGNNGNSSVISVSDASVFNNLGTFVIDAFADYIQLSNSGAAATFNNLGSVTVSADPLGPVTFSVPFNMTAGSVDIQGNGGQLALSGGGSITGGSFNIESGGALDLDASYSFVPTTTITGAGALSSDGPATVPTNIGAVILPGNYAFTGTTNVLNGTLQVDGSLTGSVVTFPAASDGELSGTGTVGGITGSGAVTPGILTADGDVVQPAAFLPILNGPDPGTGYSQLVSTGQVELNDCSFFPQLGFTPTDGEQFTIIKSDAPIVGTFDKLAEGASLTINKVPFTITYKGGDGDDVVLTQAIEPAAPTVTGVSPSSGPAAGGTPVTIAGIGFTGATAVDFGTQAATDVTVVSATTITATSPAGSGAVDVTVVTPGGTSATSPADRFTYTASVAAPSVTGISPDTGPAAGGTLVTITGSGFTGATAVDFGTNAATNVTVVSATTITADSPAGAGTVDVAVTTPSGTSATSPADEFTYTAVAAPTVTGITPDSGPTAGGTTVTIAGSGFTGATAIDFGTTAATGVVVVNSTTITANSPAGSGVVDVTVFTPEGTSATSSADRFTYTAAVVAAPTVTGVSPDSGPTAGGTTVTIAGTGFTGATAVDFGTTAATDVVVVNGTTITAVSPAGAGVADVTVITSAGASATTPADRFTYVAPPVTVVSVNRFGFHMHPTTFVLTFDSPLDAVRASDPASYQLVDMAHPLRRLGFRSATYNPANQSVTLSPFHRLYLYDHYRLTVINPQSMAVTVAGDPADGGTAGGNFATTISPANLILTPAQRRDRPLLALIRSLAVKFPGLAHLVDGRAPRPGA